MTTLDVNRDEHRLEQFLIGRDPRQVWTRTRDDGAAFYLENGRKADYDASSLACIVRGCDGPIILVEGERRTHYRHASGTQHRRSLSELHASAAAVRAWAVAAGKSVLPAEEHRDAEIITVVDPDRGSSTVSYVVVSENLSSGALRDLHGDAALGASNVQWFLWAGLIGSTEGDGGRARIPNVARHLLENGESVLIINPESRLVGTFISAGDPHRQPSGKSDRCFVSICSLNDCTLDARGQMVTPALSGQRRWAENQERKEKACQGAAAVPVPPRPATVRQVAAHRSVTAPVRSPGLPVPAVKSLEPTVWNANEAWENSKIRRQVLERFGEPLPALLIRTEPVDNEVDALPVHWHCVLYLQVIEQSRRALATKTIVERLAGHGWPAPVALSLRESRAIPNYLEYLVEHGILRRVGESRYECVRNIQGAPRWPRH